MKPVRKRKSPTKEKTQEEVPPENTLESPAKKPDVTPQLSATSPVRSKQGQRKETAEKPTSLDTGPLLKKGKTVQYLVDQQIPSNVRWGIAATEANLKNASKQLQDFLAFAEGDNNCQLVVNVEAADETGHGDTGVYVRDPGGKEEWLLIEEALLLRPELVTKPQGFRVEVNVSAGAKSPPVDPSTTMLHEMELHVAPAGHLIMNMVKKGGGEEMLDLVLDHMRRADDHISLDGQEQYLRTAARVLERATSDTMEWAEQLFRAVSKDALEQFAVYAVKEKDTAAALTAMKWLSDLVDALEGSRNSRAPNAPRPVLTQTPISGPLSAEAIDREKLLGHLAGEVSQRTDMIDIVTDARTRLGLPVSAVVDLYRTTVVPALLRLAPEDVTSIKQQLFFLTRHGVPSLVALEAIDAAIESPQTTTTTGPETGIKISWPPEEPTFWLTTEEEKTWYFRDGVPTEMRTAKNLAHGAYVLIDGEKYRVAVSDKKEMPPGSTLKSTYNPEMKKWLALIKPTR